MDQPDHRLPRDSVRDRDAPQWKAPQKIVSAVDRIDDPAPLASPSPALLPERTILREGLGQTSADQRLDLAVGDANEVLRPLRLARQSGATGEISGREVPSLADQPVATVRRVSIVMAADRPPGYAAIAWAWRKSAI